MVGKCTGATQQMFSGGKNSFSMMISKPLCVRKDHFGAFQGIVMYSTLTCFLPTTVYMLQDINSSTSPERKQPVFSVNMNIRSSEMCLFSTTKRAFKQLLGTHPNICEREDPASTVAGRRRHKTLTANLQRRC